MPLPRAPLRERRARGSASYRSAQLFEQDVGQRRRGLADGEPRMPAPLEQHDRPPEPAEGQRRQRAGEPGADDGDVSVRLVETRRVIRKRGVGSQAAQLAAGNTRCSGSCGGADPGAARSTRRTTRTPADPRVGEHAAGALPRQCLKGAFERALEIDERRRHEKPGPRRALRRRRCRSASESARRPMRRTRTRGHRSAQPLRLLAGGTNGGANQEEHAQRRTELQHAVGRPAELVERHPLFSCSSASGCAVSSPIATSSPGPAQSPAARARAARKRVRRGPINAGCDSTITCETAREPHRERLVVQLGDGTRVEEAAGVVQLDMLDALAACTVSSACIESGVGSRRQACPPGSCTATGRTSRSATGTRGRSGRP